MANSLLSTVPSEQLFACTNCHVKVRFEELSSIQQLCKACRKLFPVCQCRFCKLEYHKLAGDSNKACKSCNGCFKQFGEPKRCGFCTQQAAFQGTLCSRCQYSEKKYGSPIFCDKCKLKCAFRQSAEKKEKVDGKTLCLLCMLDYKKEKYRDMKRQKDDQGSFSSSSSLAKKPKWEPSNNESSNHSGTKRSSVAEPLKADHIVEVEGLKEQIANLKKQLGEKDRMILEKERRIGELQGDHLKKEKEFRVKLQAAQKDNVSEVEVLQSTIRDLRRQISIGLKSSRTAPKSKATAKAVESFEHTQERDTNGTSSKKTSSPHEDATTSDD